MFVSVNPALGKTQGFLIYFIMKLLLVFSFILISCQNKQTVKVSRVYDGDTFYTTDDKIVRLAEIDCPEIGQEYGEEAKKFVSNLITDSVVSLLYKGEDIYGREVCEVYIKGVWLNKLLVDSGYAWAYKKYSSLYTNQLIAKNNRIGLWKYSYTPPFIYRKQHKK